MWYRSTDVNAAAAPGSPSPEDPASKPRRVLPPVSEIMAIETRRSRLPPSRAANPTAWKAGFAYLAETYRPAMIQYVGAIVRDGSRSKGNPDLAEEIVQSWFASSMEHDWLVPKDGPIRSFRAFLKDQLRKHAHNELDHRLAKRRHPGRVRRLAKRDEPASPGNDPAISVLDRTLMDIAFRAAMARLREKSPGHAAVINLMLQTNGRGTPDLSALAEFKGSRERDVVRSAQRRLAKLFREELEKTVRDAEELEILLRILDRFLP